jgi:hypothetical protein
MGKEVGGSVIRLKMREIERHIGILWERLKTRSV